jgi:septal ring factor EnvC (AmiA/AmiB activator)
MREGEEKDDEGKKFLDTINVGAFRSEKGLDKNRQKGKKEIKSLSREVDGYTAKLIKIKIKLWEFRDKIRRVLKEKVG